MFGVTAIAHLLIIAAIVITVSTFEVAKRKPDSFVGVRTGGEKNGPDCYLLLGVSKKPNYNKVIIRRIRCRNLALIIVLLWW